MLRYCSAAALISALCLGTACDSRARVVVYSPHGVDILRAYEDRFEAEHPEYNLQFLDMGAQEIVTRLSAEKNRPACDVWWGGPSTDFMRAAEAGLLADYRPAWAEAVRADMRDAQDRWYATHLSPLAILFNTNGYTADEVPQTWDDLLDPRWQGKIALRKPLASGTMRTFLCAMIARANDVDAGLEWLRQLHAATVEYPENPNLLFDHLKKNPERISVWLLPDIVMQRDLNGFPFGFVVPPQTPVLTEGIAIVASAPHRALAEQFYEFATREEALIQQAHDFAKLPARTDIPRTALPAWMTAQEIDPMPIDWARFTQEGPDWLARWEHEVYQAP